MARGDRLTGEQKRELWSCPRLDRNAVCGRSELRALRREALRHVGACQRPAPLQVQDVLPHVQRAHQYADGPACAPRKRGGKPKMTGTSPDDYDIVLIACDRHKATSDHNLYDFEGGSFDAALAPLIERDAVLVTDGRQAYIGLAKACGVEQVTVVARAGERVINVSLR